MKVESIHIENVPKDLILDSSNLKLNESVGQGIANYLALAIIIASTVK